VNFKVLRNTMRRKNNQAVLVGLSVILKCLLRLNIYKNRSSVYIHLWKLLCLIP